PAYFNSFPITTAKVNSYGLGASKTALVNMIIKDLQINPRENDEDIWCVFDMDVHYANVANQKQDFNNAIKIANSNNIQVAYSNDCFELWFVLHYQNISAQLHRGNYYKILDHLWSCNYAKD